MVPWLHSHLKCCFRGSSDIMPASRLDWRGKAGKETRKTCKIRKIEFCRVFNPNLLPSNLFQSKWQTGILRILRKIPGGYPRGEGRENAE